MKLSWIPLLLLLIITWFALANRREKQELGRRQDAVFARRSGHERSIPRTRKRSSSGSRTWTRREEWGAEELAEREGEEDEVEDAAARQILDDKREAEEADSGLELSARLTAREKHGFDLKREEEEAEDEEEEREAAPEKIMIGYYLHPSISNTTQARCLEICYNMGENCTLYAVLNNLIYSISIDHMIRRGPSIGAGGTCPPKP